MYTIYIVYNCFFWNVDKLNFCVKPMYLMKYVKLAVNQDCKPVSMDLFEFKLLYTIEYTKITLCITLFIKEVKVFFLIVKWISYERLWISNETRL